MRLLLACLLATSSIAMAKPAPESFPQANLPDVTRTQDKLGASSGVEMRTSGTRLVTASSLGVSVGGRILVGMRDGKVDPDQKDGGSAGNMIPRLAKAVEGSDPLEIGMDRTLTYKTLFEIIYSTKTGRTNYLVLVRAGGSVVGVPIVLPSTPPTGNDLKMVVSASKTEILVWSMSGKEGTLKKPKLRIALADTDGEVQRSDAAMKVRATLEAIATKRWKGKKRAAGTQGIVLQCDGGVPLELVANLMVAVRRHFSDLSLGGGFE